MMGVQRETFIALRARREAHHVATDMLYEVSIDVRTVACRGCGAWLDVHGPTVTDPLTCPECKARTPLPPYLRARYVPRSIDLPRDRAMDYSASRASSVTWPFFDPSPEIPRWLIWFTIILITLLLGVVAWLLHR